MAQRKLRSALTALADPARRRDDRRHLRPDGPDPHGVRGHPRRPPTRAPTSSSRPRRRSATLRRAAARPSRCVERVRAVPGRRRADGQLSDSGALVVDGEEADRPGLRAGVGRGLRARSRSTRRVRTSPAASRGGRARSAVDDTAAKTRACASASTSASRRAPASSASSSSASFEFGERRRSAARPGRRRRSADVQRWFDREGECRPRSSSPPRPGRRPRSPPRRARSAAPARGRDRRARRRAAGRRRSTTRSAASYRRRCSPSPGRRCSSARSSSSTPSRSRSRSARASSRCCARSARRARQILGAVAVEALIARPGRLGPRPVRRPGVRQGAARRCSTPRWLRHPAAGSCSRRARSSSRCSSASASRCWRRSCRRSAPRACRRCGAAAERSTGRERRRRRVWPRGRSSACSG